MSEAGSERHNPAPGPGPAQPAAMADRPRRTARARRGLGAAPPRHPLLLRSAVPPRERGPAAAGSRSHSIPSHSIPARPGRCSHHLAGVREGEKGRGSRESGQRREGRGRNLARFRRAGAAGGALRGGRSAPSLPGAEKQRFNQNLRKFASLVTLLNSRNSGKMNTTSLNTIGV